MSKDNENQVMREILYQAVETDGTLVQGIPFYAHGTGEWKISLSSGWTPSYNNPDEGESTVLVNVDPFSIGQFADMYDDEGNRIFEHSSIRFRLKSGEMKEGVVWWSDRSLTWKVKSECGNDYRLKVTTSCLVIGNKFTKLNNGKYG